MSEQFSISIDKLINDYKIGVGNNNNFLITTQIISSIELLDFPCRINAIVMGVCQKGEILFTSNFKELKLQRNSCCVLTPGELIGFEKISSDFEGSVILIGLDYIKNINIDISEAISYYISARNNPCFQVDDMTNIKRFFEALEETIKDKNSQWKEAILKGLVSALIYKLCDILEQHAKKGETFKTKSKEFYFFKFLELCSQNYHKRRDIGYYANEICISPKYLSTIVKEVSGLSAVEWIDEYIINEAKIQLKFSNKNIQQISDSLNFSNQSLFGRYFKRHVGMSASNYKASCSSIRKAELDVLS